MLRLIIISSLVYLMAVTSAAAECPLFTPKFGERIEQTVGHYNLDALYDGADNYTEIAARGSDLCKELSDDTAVRFVFMKNTFVKLRIEKLDSKDILLSLVEAKFGKIENKPSSLIPGNPQFQHLWKPADGMSVLYSSHPHRGTMMEYIELSSLKHNALSNEVYKEQETESNRLKER